MDDDLVKELQIINLDKDSHTISLNEELLEKILLSEEVRDSKVMVLSVAGAFRQGKSFLLNFFIRYLKAVESGDNENRAWLSHRYKHWLVNGKKWNDESDVDPVDEEDGYTIVSKRPIPARNEPLIGFSSQGGSNMVTNGILMWGKPFIVTNNGEKIAVLLMDTQGTFDNETIMADWSAVFAMSTLISSVQVYNLSQRIREDDLQNLNVFTSYGELAMESSDCTPFQSLVFLVRDWYNDYEYSFGADGGHDFLNKVLEVKESQHPELKAVRTSIYRCFEKVKCFMMPHPGMKVASQRNFGGNLAEIEEAFLDNLSKLAFLLLHPSNLVAKKQQDNYLTGKMLLERFKVYTKAFQDSELLKPKTLFQVNAESNHLETLLIAKHQYIHKMEMVVSSTTQHIDEKDFYIKHQEYKIEAITKFINAKRLGSDEYQRKYEDQLAKEIDEEYQQFTEKNNSRDVSGWWRRSALYGGASAGTGIAYVGVASLEVGSVTAAGIAALPIASGVLAATATAFLAAWADKRFNQGRVSNKVQSSWTGWWGKKDNEEKSKNSNEEDQDQTDLATKKNQ